MKVLDGWARKVGLVAVGVSLIGWLIFVICFGSFNNGDNFYNDIRENRVVRVGKEGFPAPVGNQSLYLFLSKGQDLDEVDVPLMLPGREPLISDQTIEEDFPKNRADSDFFTFYWFVVVHPIAALLTIAHLLLHGVPVLGFILSIAAHLLLTLTLVCGSGAFWAEGNRLFSADNNYRNEVNSLTTIEVVPSDWKMDPYWGAWLVGEWVGLLITGICLIVYYTVTPFFTNTKLFSKTTPDSYEMKGHPADSKGDV